MVLLRSITLLLIICILAGNMKVPSPAFGQDAKPPVITLESTTVLPDAAAYASWSPDSRFILISQIGGVGSDLKLTDTGFRVYNTEKHLLGPYIKHHIGADEFRWSPERKYLGVARFNSFQLLDGLTFAKISETDPVITGCALGANSPSEGTQFEFETDNSAVWISCGSGAAKTNTYRAAIKLSLPDLAVMESVDAPVPDSSHPHFRPSPTFLTIADGKVEMAGQLMSSVKDIRAEPARRIETYYYISTLSPKASVIPLTRTSQDDFISSRIAAYHHGTKRFIQSELTRTSLSVVAELADQNPTRHHKIIDAHNGKTISGFIENNSITAQQGFYKFRFSRTGNILFGLAAGPTLKRTTTKANFLWVWSLQQIQFLQQVELGPVAWYDVSPDGQRLAVIDRSGLKLYLIDEPQ